MKYLIQTSTKSDLGNFEFPDKSWVGIYKGQTEAPLFGDTAKFLGLCEGLEDSTISLPIAISALTDGITINNGDLSSDSSYDKILRLHIDNEWVEVGNVELASGTTSVSSGDGKITFTFNDDDTSTITFSGFTTEILKTIQIRKVANKTASSTTSSPNVNDIEIYNATSENVTIKYYYSTDGSIHELTVKSGTTEPIEYCSTTTMPYSENSTYVVNYRTNSSISSDTINHLGVKYVIDYKTSTSSATSQSAQTATSSATGSATNSATKTSTSKA